MDLSSFLNNFAKVSSGISRGIATSGQSVIEDAQNEQLTKILSDPNLTDAQRQNALITSGNPKAMQLGVQLMSKQQNDLKSLAEQALIKKNSGFPLSPIENNYLQSYSEINAISKPPVATDKQLAQFDPVSGGYVPVPFKALNPDYNPQVSTNPNADLSPLLSKTLNDYGYTQTPDQIASGGNRQTQNNPNQKYVNAEYDPFQTPDFKLEKAKQALQGNKTNIEKLNEDARGASDLSSKLQGVKDFFSQNQNRVIFGNASETRETLAKLANTIGYKGNTKLLENTASGDALLKVLGVDALTLVKGNANPTEFAYYTSTYGNRQDTPQQLIARAEFLTRINDRKIEKNALQRQFYDVTPVGVGMGNEVLAGQPVKQGETFEAFYKRAIMPSLPSIVPQNNTDQRNTNNPSAPRVIKGFTAITQPDGSIVFERTK